MCCIIGVEAAGHHGLKECCAPGILTTVTHCWPEACPFQYARSLGLARAACLGLHTSLAAQTCGFCTSPLVRCLLLISADANLDGQGLSSPSSCLHFGLAGQAMFSLNPEPTTTSGALKQGQDGHFQIDRQRPRHLSASRHLSPGS